MDWSRSRSINQHCDPTSSTPARKQALITDLMRRQPGTHTETAVGIGNGVW